MENHEAKDSPEVIKASRPDSGWWGRGRLCETAFSGCLERNIAWPVEIWLLFPTSYWKIMDVGIT